MRMCARHANSMVLYELQWCDASEKGTFDLPTPEGVFLLCARHKIIILLFQYRITPVFFFAPSS